jgi:hypothetical protein
MEWTICPSVPGQNRTHTTIKLLAAVGYKEKIKVNGTKSLSMIINLFQLFRKNDAPVIYDTETQRANFFSFVENVSRTVNKERHVKHL